LINDAFELAVWRDFGSGDSVIGGGSSLKKAELDPVEEIV
jgi:hypothetical protein